MNVYEMVSEIKKYALENDVPIMQDDGIDFLTSYIDKEKIEKVLEIGTAIGYSAIMMALSNPRVYVTSIERDQNRYLEAVKNIKKLGLENRITLIFQDALDVELTDKYDLIFVDAAKGQNIKFFEKFSKNLKENGTIITDNLDFHGLVEMDEAKIESRNVRGLVRKIKAYITYLKEHPTFDTKFYHLGDGISVSKRKS